MKTGLPPFLRLVPAFRYRLVRPLLWKFRTNPRLERVSDDNLFQALGFEGDAANFVDALKERSRLRFFFHPRNRKDFFLNTLTSTEPYEAILEEADHVLHNRFQTLGSPLMDLGDPIRWQRDYDSGHEWPLNPSHELQILDRSHLSDVKFSWELGRFHQVWWLGKAYWLTGNNAYAEKFASLVSHWVHSNPPGRGVHWVNAMEASIRACNLIAGFYFFCEAPGLDRKFWVLFVRSLVAHALFIEHHLEYARVSKNHFLSNVVGLMYLGIFLQDLPAGKRWLRWGLEQLPREMEEQVYEDGVHHEKSVAYHRLVLEFFYSAALLCKTNHIALPPTFWSRLERMMEFTFAYTRPDGSVPLVGDSDDGRLFRISMKQEVNDHRHALSVGAILFRRADFSQRAGRFDQEALWYFGGEGFEVYRTLQSPRTAPHSSAFPRGGFYIMQRDLAHLFADVGDIGARGIGSHGHNDTLSFELWYKSPIIVDSGTHNYTKNSASRKLLQGTGAHNTLVVDDREIAEWAGLWELKEDLTDPGVINWEMSEEKDFLDAEHKGYARLSDPVLHRRKWKFDKQGNEVLVTDVVTGHRAHSLQFRFHFHPSVVLKQEGTRSYRARNGEGTILLSCSEDVNIIDTSFSPSYGVLLPSKGLQVRLDVKLPYTLTTRITLL